jgi:hypothetical protein
MGMEDVTPAVAAFSCAMSAARKPVVSGVTTTVADAIGPDDT